VDPRHITAAVASSTIALALGACVAHHHGSQRAMPAGAVPPAPVIARVSLSPRPSPATPPAAPAAPAPSAAPVSVVAPACVVRVRRHDLDLRFTHTPEVPSFRSYNADGLLVELVAQLPSRQVVRSHYRYHGAVLTAVERVVDQEARVGFERSSGEYLSSESATLLRRRQHIEEHTRLLYDAQGRLDLADRTEEVYEGLSSDHGTLRHQSGAVATRAYRYTDSNDRISLDGQSVQDRVDHFTYGTGVTLRYLRGRLVDREERPRHETVGQYRFRRYRFRYDRRGRRTQTDELECDDRARCHTVATERYAYGPSGRLERATRAHVRVVRFSYEPTGALARADGVGPRVATWSVRWSYDDDGRLLEDATEEPNASHRITYEYGAECPRRAFGDLTPTAEPFLLGYDTPLQERRLVDQDDWHDARP
jgi:hypothetical protein